jgi:hypothetical protein
MEGPKRLWVYGTFDAGLFEGFSGSRSGGRASLHLPAFGNDPAFRVQGSDKQNFQATLGAPVWERGDLHWQLGF